MNKEKESKSRNSEILDELKNINKQKQSEKNSSFSQPTEEKTAKDDEEIKNNTEEKNESSDSEMDLLSQELVDLKDEKLRLLAEMDNLRKRSDKERIESIKYGSINFARDVLTFGDNLSRALDSIPNNEKKSKTIENLIDGLNMVKKDFTLVLSKHGIKKISALNEKFDHNLHQAMMEIENSEVEEGIVIQEVQSGFTMHDRLLRPSMVGVSKKPVNDEKQDEK